MRKYILLIFFALVLVSCSKEQKTLVIGVSQCSEDIWREHMNDELRTASYQYDNVKLKFVSTRDKTHEQVQQINQLIQEGVDLLIVSPNQLHAISPVIDKAYDKGIPVVLFDRKTDSRKYTAFVGADNYKIGKMMGEYVARKLKGKGNIVEIEGLMSSSPAVDRHRGFAEAISKYPELKILESRTADWLKEPARGVMDTLLRKYPKIDCVFGQDDRMALGAREAAEKAGRVSEMIFVGVDALPAKDAGMESVRDRKLEASYFYPSRGDLVMKLAMDILEGRPYQKDMFLQSTLVTKDNAEQMLMMQNAFSSQISQLEELHNKTDLYFTNYQHQRIYLVLAVVIIVLLLLLFTIIYRDIVRRHHLAELEAADKLRFFTDVSHEIRTPLTLIIDPVFKLCEDISIQGKSREILELIKRNTISLQKMVESILDEQKLQYLVNGQPEESSQLAQTANKATQEERNTQHILSQDDDRQRLLVIDDNQDIRSYVRTILHDRYVVLEAANGKEGLDIAMKEVPDLVICDVMMPVMDGLQFCKNLKTNIATSHIPVVMLTAKTLDEQRIEGYEHGADAYITKPFSNKLLLARIENLLRERSRLRSIFYTGESENNTKEVDERDRNFIERLRRIIADNLDNCDFNVETIGKEVGLSRAQLYRKVKAMTGSSVVDLIKMARLHKAQQLLNTTDMSISEVAYSVGFAAPSYFARCFREEFGITPAEHRGDKKNAS